jgi:signal transduction histidine kinase/CheY-like chemotaxis protein
MPSHTAQVGGAEAPSPAPETLSDAYQATLQGFRLPLPVHMAFNLASAAGMLLLGHPWIAAISFVAGGLFDVAQQALVRSWIATAGQTEQAEGLARLARLSAVRSCVYTAPTVALVLNGGGPELAFFGLQLATMLAVSLAAGALSRMIFWASFAPLLLEVAVLAFLLFPLNIAGAILLSVASLTLLLLMITAGTIQAISTWHASFQANLALVGDLEAARDAARQANRAKSNFLATMSHEIRTPMNGVLGMAQLLKRDEADPAQTARLDVLIDSGEYLLAILNDILDVSKIDAGKLEMAPAAEPLRPFLERVVGFWSARADERGVALRLTVGEAAPQALMFDALRLRQVLFNLLGNALKFTDAGEVELIADATPAADGRVLLALTVRDTGPGIAARNIPNLFDRFSQVEDSEARRFGGTGLGLAIVRQLVELMGGRVSVESVVGEGSSFRLEIPLPLAEVGVGAALPAAPPPEAPSEAATLALRVLAVDDNAVNLLVLEQLLTSFGQTVAKASSGPEALEALAAETFDLVLMDIQMPGMSGIEALQRLRAQAGPNRAVPVIALTADVTSGGRQRYLDLGFTDHSSKPIQLQDLLDAIGRALSAPGDAAAYSGASNVSR